MNDPNLPSGWAFAFPETLAANERYALGIGPFGSNLKVSDYTQTGVPLVFVRHIRSENFAAKRQHFVTEDKARELRAHEVHPGDVLITKMGDPPGDSALYPRSHPVGIITADCIKWRIAPSVGLSEFFVYATRTHSIQHQIQEITKGVAQKKVSLERFRSVKYPVAPLPEQHRIVEAIDSYFSRLDDAVATLERVQRNLKRYRASVLKAAVEGRLVPTEAELAKAEGRDYEPASKLLERILVERRRRWEEAELAKMKAKGKAPKDDKWKKKYKEPVAPDTSGLPDLPEGWCWATVEMLADQRLGKMLDKAKNQGIARPYLRNANVRWFGFDLTDLAEMRITDEEFSSVSVLSGDLVVCEGGEPGRCAVWLNDKKPIAIQKALHRVRPYAGVLPSFLSCVLAADAQSHKLSDAFTGTTIKHFTGEALRSYIVPVPPFQEQHRITSEVDVAVSLIARLTKELFSSQSRSTRLRQSILKWAFEGKLVDQDPNDEPASVLLARIKAEREKAGANQPKRRNPRKKKA